MLVSLNVAKFVPSLCYLCSTCRSVVLVYTLSPPFCGEELEPDIRRLRYPVHLKVNIYGLTLFA